jgi:hypothetical protein
MNHTDQEDALWKLLGKARTVEPKGNFLPNVMRAIRQTPQERGFWAKLKGWWVDSSTPSWAMPATAVAALVMAAGSLQFQSPVSPVITPQVTKITTEPAPAILAEEAVSPLTTLDEVDALLAMEDTSSLSDQEISFLLY